MLTNADDGWWVIEETVRTIAQEYAWPDYFPQRVEVPIDSQIYNAYVGEYEVRSGFSFRMSSRNDGLYLEVTGQAPIALHPSSAINFFTNVTKSEITFTKNEGGKVTGLILKQEQQETKAKKVQ